MKIGIDIGGTLRFTQPSTDDVKEFLAGQPNKDALEVASWILQTVQADNVYIICRSSQASEIAVMTWLDEYGFIDAGLKKENVYFCRQVEEKVHIAKGLGLDVFVDDLMAVLEPMKGIVTHRILFSEDGTLDQPADNTIIKVDSWKEAKQHLQSYIS